MAQDDLQIGIFIENTGQVRASAVPILPEPIMAYFIDILQSLSGC